MQRFLFVVMFGVSCALISCGAAPCDLEQVSGSYLLHFTTLGGDCGDVDTQVVVFDDFTKADRDCQHSMQKSEDSCEVEVVGSCHFQEEGFDITITGKYYFMVNEDGSTIPTEAFVTMEIDYYTYGYYCMGTYKLLYQKL